MNAALKSVVFGSVLTSLLGVVQIASAAPPHIELRLSPGSRPSLYVGPGTSSTPYITPSPSPSPYIMPVAPSSVRLGFYGHFEWGYGMVVDSVPWGTPAQRMGLESGDVIVAINGLWLRSQSDYYRALAYGGDHARVTVQDVRSGGLVTRTAHLHEDGYAYRSGASGYRSGPSVSLELR